MATAVLSASCLAGAAPPATATPRVAAVAWQRCDPAVVADVPAVERAKLSCATHPVPLDWDNGAAGTLSLALMRRAADDPAHRIGTLFVNVGGPGGSGFFYTRTAYQKFSAGVRARFDIVGFDPRGVGRSNPARCFTSQEQANELLVRSFAVPVTAGQIASTTKAAADYSQLCRANAGPLLGRLSTLDVVRDLDSLRAAVGDEKLNYVGLSYGTLIGATFIAMYPARVRAIVMDGNVDPALRTSDGVEYARQRAEGFEAVLAAVLSRCDRSGARCSFGPGSAGKFAALRDLLRKHDLVRPDGSTVTISSFTMDVVSLLQQPALFGALADELQADYELMRAATPAVALAQRTPYLADDSYYAVNCSDEPFPAGFDAAAAAQRWERTAPTFARYQAFLEPVQCPTWPVPAGRRFAGPWQNRSPSTALVYGNYHDPATPYVFATRMAAELGNARLVTVDAFGHTILGGSACTAQITEAYLVGLQLPAPETVCQPDAQPFS
jgi:pimeloyl-ACP methyl ester carboxylesterase